VLEVIGAGGTAFGPKYSGQARWRAAAPAREGLPGALTPRERQVLRRIVAGQSTEKMAREMDVAISTLRSYIKNILAKLGAHSRLQAAAIASREPGLVNGTQRIMPMARPTGAPRSSAPIGVPPPRSIPWAER